MEGLQQNRQNRNREKESSRDASTRRQEGVAYTMGHKRNFIPTSKKIWKELRMRIQEQKGLNKERIAEALRKQAASRLAGGCCSTSLTYNSKNYIPGTLLLEETSTGNLKK